MNQKSNLGWQYVIISIKSEEDGYSKLWAKRCEERNNMCVRWGEEVKWFFYISIASASLWTSFVLSTTMSMDALMNQWMQRGGIFSLHVYFTMQDVTQYTTCSKKQSITFVLLIIFMNNGNLMNYFMSYTQTSKSKKTHLLMHL